MLGRGGTSAQTKVSPIIIIIIIIAKPLRKAPARPIYVQTGVCTHSRGCWPSFLSSLRCYGCSYTCQPFSTPGLPPWSYLGTPIQSFIKNLDSSNSIQAGVDKQNE